MDVRPETSHDEICLSQRWKTQQQLLDLIYDTCRPEMKLSLIVMSQYMHVYLYYNIVIVRQIVTELDLGAPVSPTSHEQGWRVYVVSKMKGNFRVISGDNIRKNRQKFLLTFPILTFIYTFASLKPSFHTSDELL